ncbi:MAG: peptide chain release factor N(5)-glutamine methyltransferase [Candidatus Omnitrophica bacterium]|nr:peptide chain release factor N(5)-glutamine methyltransferase [Candidatus Omnitrophota bacterium]
MNEIETILCKVLKCDRGGLYLERGRSVLSNRQFNRLEKILTRRASGEPLQYLVGDTEFMGLKFKVACGVLIPRPETEVLVEAVLQWIGPLDKELDVLDIGTGSGNIAISLAANDAKKRLNIFAVDISDVCLKKARSNAKLNHAESKVAFLKSDIFSCFHKQKKMFDCIVSNPPYVSPKEYRELPPDVKNEPSCALLAADAGFYYYKKIEKGARKHLTAGGKIFLEIGDSQAEGIKKIFSDTSVWENMQFIKDLCGVDRVVIIEKK